MSILSTYIRWLESDPELVAAGFAWDKVFAWDRAHTNKAELWDREAQKDAVRQAFATLSPDPEAAFQMFLALAQSGSVQSMFNVGVCYHRGDGVSCDFAEAEHWYGRASAGGSQAGMYECSRFAASRQDFAACEKILCVGVDQDWAPAIFWFAWYRHKQSDSHQTYRAILPLLEDAARKGHPGAEFVCLNFMARGKFGRFKIPQGVIRCLIYAVRSTLKNEGG